MLTVMPEEDGLVAIRVDGRLARRDIDRATEAIDAALASTSGPIPLLVSVGDLGFITPPALLADIKYGVKNLRNLSRFEKVAVVTDSRLVGAFATAQDLMLPSIAVKVFGRSEETVARHWLTGVADSQPASPVPPTPAV